MEEDFRQVYNNIRPRYPELAGMAALVTGSTRGIGKGIAMRLGREGMRVAVTGRSRDDIDPLVADLRGVGVDAFGFAADLGKAGENDRLMDAVLRAFEAVNVLVNNAGDIRRFELDKIDEAIFEYQMNVNVKAPFALTKRALPGMKAAGGGSVIFTSSVGGLRAHWRGMPYDATKGALDAMTRALALETAEHGVRVNGIAPGATWIEKRGSVEDNPFAQAVAKRIPLGRFGFPLEMGAAVAFLASPDAAYITGQVLYVDGGITAQLYPKGQDI